jgi:hypothetical protein
MFRCRATPQEWSVLNSRIYIRRRSAPLLLATAFALVGCGGGGGGSAAPTPAAASTRPVDQSDMQIAQLLYAGTVRTPADFYSDPAPSGQTHVSTTHLKNADIATGTAGQPLHELCTNDWNEALSWSETAARNAPQYSDLMETNDEARYFEFGRARQGDPDFYLRARVFKCAYLDRSSADLRSIAGPAGRLNQRPLTAAELRTLSEYLWQFTIYNNFGHTVLKSTGATSTGGLSHTLYIANLVRNGTSTNCDRVDVQSWMHTVDSASGDLALDVRTLWSFGTRESAGVAQGCQ